jgi:hypothetical protein
MEVTTFVVVGQFPAEVVSFGWPQFRAEHGRPGARAGKVMEVTTSAVVGLAPRKVGQFQPRRTR